MAAENETLITLTADIVAAHVSNNNVATNDVGGLIEKVYKALSGLGVPAEPVEEKPEGAVSIRASVKQDHIVSMIDGKPYKMLRRHLGQNGYTPESYRETFGLPRDYPMVAPSYAEQRRALAKKIGLGRKRKLLRNPPLLRNLRGKRELASQSPPLRIEPLSNSLAKLEPWSRFARLFAQG